MIFWLDGNIFDSGQSIIAGIKNFENLTLEEGASVWQTIFILYSIIISIICLDNNKMLYKSKNNVIFTRNTIHDIATRGTFEKFGVVLW